MAPQNLQNNFCCPRKERNFRASEVKDCANKKYLRIKETDELVWKIVTETLSKSHLHKEKFKNEVLGTTENYKKQSNRLKTFRRRKNKLENEISEMKESIIRLETDKVLKKRSPEELEKIISGVEENRLGLIRELEGLQSAIYGISSSMNCVNWAQKISKRIDDSDLLTPEERKDFLENTIT